MSSLQEVNKSKAQWEGRCLSAGVHDCPNVYIQNN
jgi:hypothetical protein